MQGAISLAFIPADAPEKTDGLSHADFYYVDEVTFAKGLAHIAAKATADLFSASRIAGLFCFFVAKEFEGEEPTDE